MGKRKLGRPKSGIETVQVSCMLPVDVQGRARKLAAKDGLTLAGWMRRLIYRDLAAA